MYKTLTVGSLVPLVLWAHPTRQLLPPGQLKEEAAIIEYNASTEEASLVVEAESEVPLEQVEITNPRGASILELRRGAGQPFSLSGFVVETEMTSSAALLASHTEGVYRISAQTTEGGYAIGYALLSHRLPNAPVLLHPLDGAVGVEPELIVSWQPDAQAVAYRVGLEQGESDGLTVQLPRGTHSFQVPAGVLSSGKETHLEVAAITINGNRTQVEIDFETR
jgi:hypothetical protein